MKWITSVGHGPTYPTFDRAQRANGPSKSPFLKGDLGGFSNGLYGATLVVALQGGHKTRPYQKIPLTPLLRKGGE